MKFDPKKPHGIVMNHPWIRYEQGGRLFDFNGEPTAIEVEEVPQEEMPEFVAPVEVVETLAQPTYEYIDRDNDLERAKVFLNTILKEGPLRRSEVFRLSEQNNLQWQKVKEAFQEIEGQMHKRGPSLYWQLRQM